MVISYLFCIDQSYINKNEKEMRKKYWGKIYIKTMLQYELQKNEFFNAFNCKVNLRRLGFLFYELSLLQYIINLLFTCKLTSINF